jgi:cell division protein FtsN
VRPAREADDDFEPVPRQAKQRTATTHAGTETVAGKRAATKRTAKATDDDDDDTPKRGRTPQTAAERRRALAEARAEAAESHRHAPSREERRRGVTVMRASTSDERPSRASRHALDDEPSKPTSRSRTGRHSPEGDVDDASRGATRGTSRSQPRDRDKDLEKYTVQLGPYRNRKAVETARADLSRQGYEARVVGQKLQLGNFAERSRADKLASRLRVSGHPATSAELR